MANVVYGPIVSGVAGSIGGTTFQKSGAGNIARRRPLPPRPQKANQRAAQAMLAEASKWWTQWNPVVKIDWTNYGKTIDLHNSLGVLYHPNGQQIFSWHWIQSRLCGHDNWCGLVPTAPGLSIEYEPVFTFAAHDLSVDSFYPAPASNFDVFLSISYPDSPRAFARTLVKATFLIDQDTVLPVVIAAAIDSGFAVGSIIRVHVRARFFNESTCPSLKFGYFKDITVV